MFFCDFFRKYFSQKLASNSRRPYICTTITDNGFAKYAKVAQLVERDLAKVEVAGSNPVFRSGEQSTGDGAFFLLTGAGNLAFAGVVELVDTQDLKSCEPKRSYGFDSRPRYRCLLLCSERHLLNNPAKIILRYF